MVHGTYPLARMFAHIFHPYITVHQRSSHNEENVSFGLRTNAKPDQYVSISQRVICRRLCPKGAGSDRGSL